MSVADAFDAMRHDRSYRTARPIEAAISEIVQHAGNQFNPAVVDTLERLQAKNASPLMTPSAPADEGA